MPDLSKVTRDTMWKWARENVRPESAAIELRWRHARMMCANSMWFLATEVLGYGDLDPDFHGRMCKRLERWPMRADMTPFPYMGDAWPRGGFKTTLATVSRSIQTVLRCVEETILLEHGELKQAGNILTEIKGHLEENEILKWLFPDILYSRPTYDAPKWTNEAATIKRKGVYKEPTFSISSAESDSTGGHFTYLIFDDLVTEKNVNTPEQIKKVHDHFKKVATGPLKDERYIKKGSRLWLPRYEYHQFYNPDTKTLELPHRRALIFTSWDANDSNAKVIDEKNAEFAGQVDWIKEMAWHADPRHPEGGTSFFPKKFPKWNLKEIMASMGPSGFSAQYQQDPYPSEAQILKKKFLQWYRPEDIARKKLEYFTGIDANFKSNDPGSDHGVIMTVAVDDLGMVYIIRLDRGQYSPDEQIDAVIRHTKMFKPKRVAFEVVSGGEILYNMLLKKAKALDVKMNIQRITRGGRSSVSKNMRILSMEPIFAAQRIFLPKISTFTDAFVEEMTRWNPNRKDQPDDQLDCLSDLLRLVTEVDPAIVRRKKVQKDDAPDFVIPEGKIMAGTGESVLSGIGVTSGRRSRRRR